MSDYSIIGIREVQAALDGMVTSARAAAVTIVKAGEAEVEAEIKKQFAGAHRRGTPTPSSPGQPPAVISGTLRRSIHSERPTVTGLGAAGRVYPTAVYARIQELGGHAGHSTLPARPYVRPGYEAAKPKLAAIAAAEWGKWR